MKEVLQVKQKERGKNKALQRALLRVETAISYCLVVFNDNGRHTDIIFCIVLR